MTTSSNTAIVPNMTFCRLLVFVEDLPFFFFFILGFDGVDGFEGWRVLGFDGFDGVCLQKRGLLELWWLFYDFLIALCVGPSSAVEHPVVHGAAWFESVFFEQTYACGVVDADVAVEHV